jgi:hypothetical protein
MYYFTRFFNVHLLRSDTEAGATEQMNTHTQDKVKHAIRNTAIRYTLITNSAAIQTAQFHLAINDNRLVMDHNSSWFVYMTYGHVRSTLLSPVTTSESHISN